MSLWSDVAERVRSLLFRSREEREFEEELALHLEMEVRKNVSAGMRPEEARRRALLALGGTEKTKEDVRDARGLRLTEDLVRDLRLALRSLRRTPGFTASAVLILALGIGLATAVFTVAEAILLRSLPVADQERLVVLSGATRDGRIDDYPLGLEDARDFARRSRALAHTAFFAYPGVWTRVVRDGGSVSRLHYTPVSGDFFSVLGARPLLGRALRPEDDARGAEPVLVLSHRAWEERFGAAADVVGRRIVMNDDGVAYTVVGVMPEGLDFPRGAEAWVPVRAVLPERALSHVAFLLLGRLAPGATPAAARDELTAYLRRAANAARPLDLRGSARPLPRLVVGDARPAVLVFAAAAGLLLLITCINVANLLLVRGLARVREVAVRSALGAGRGRVIRQLLTEHALLAVAGGALGLGVAALAVRGFVAFAPPGLPRLDGIRLNGAALAGAVGITALALLLFALAPAVVASRVEVQAVLRSSARQSAGGRSRRAADALVAGQVALALLVLSATALLGRSFINLDRADLALEPSHLLVAELGFPSRYDTAPKQLALLERLLPAVEAIPGVRAASPAVAAPFVVGWDFSLAAEEQTPEEAAANPTLNADVVAPEYFAALGLPVLRGRGFTEADREGAPPVVVISRSAARHYWPGQDPLGKRLVLDEPSGRRLWTVVGVVPDTRYRELREARPGIYFPLRQSSFPFAPTNLLIETSGEPGATVPALRHVLAEIDPGIALPVAAPFESYLARPLAQPRLNALLLAAFSLAAVLLAAMGLFGVLATTVRRRTHELGIRMALGASAGAVGALVLRRGMAVAAAGTAVGLLGALAANRLLSSLLFDVSPTDAPTLGAVALILLVVAALASMVPVMSSTRVDPVQTLRSE